MYYAESYTQYRCRIRRQRAIRFGIIGAIGIAFIALCILMGGVAR